MITVVNESNNTEYRELFDKATEILSGYERVRTYDGEIDYYYKNNDAESREDLFVKVDSINSLLTFTKALEEYSILYKIGEEPPAEDFDPMVGITTLEEYFSWLRVLSKFDKKFTRLPIDEECFEINANTRAINIPASFKKNGVAI